MEFFRRQPNPLLKFEELPVAISGGFIGLHRKTNGKIVLKIFKPHFPPHVLCITSDGRDARNFDLFAKMAYFNSWRATPRIRTTLYNEIQTHGRYVILFFTL